MTVAIAALLLVLATDAAAQAGKRNAPAPRIDRHVVRIERLVAGGDIGEALKVAQGAPGSSDAAIAAWITANTGRLGPPFLLVLARRSFARDKDAALTWYYAGMLRAFYDAYLCTDTTARRGLPVLMLVAPKVAGYARANPARAAAAGRRALAWEAKQPGDTRPRWICRHGSKSYEAQLEGRTHVPGVLPREAWPEIRGKVRAIFAKGFDGMEKRAVTR